MTRCLIGLRAWIARWRPRRDRFFRLRQLAAVAATMPPFLLICASLVLYTRLKGPLRIDGRLFNGSALNCHLPDVVQLYAFLFGIWEPDSSAFVSRRLSNGDTFLDVGAHVGYYSLLASQRVGPSGGVVAIEASPAIFQQLQANLATNRCSNVRALNVAAGAVSGVLEVHRGPLWNLGWTTTMASSHLPSEGEVTALPLDEIVTVEECQTIRLIKVDVEGTERALFPGLLKLLHHAPHEAEILMELSPRWWNDSPTSVEDALQCFKDAGFHFYQMPNNYSPWRYLWPNSVQPPQRIRGPIKSWVGQLDIVLSRIDAENLD